MAKLIFLLGNKLLSEYPLNKERITIGRRPSNDIHIDNLAVSGEHAVIVTLGKDSFLEDLNSTNGTMVNQKLIKKHVLQNHDVIEFGKYQLKYIDDKPVKKPAGDGFADTVLMTPQTKPVEKPAEAVTAATAPAKIQAAPVVSIDVAKPAAAAPAQPILPPRAPVEEPADSSEQALKMGRIQILSGANSGQEVLLNRAMIKLGNPGEQLAVVTKRQHGYFITHVEGNDYPQVNGRSIGVQAHALKDYDVIELAGIKMEFYFD